MSTSVVTVALNRYPKADDLEINRVHLPGIITIAAGDYPANGIPISLAGIPTPPGTVAVKINLESPTSGFIYRYDRAHKTIRIFVQGAGEGDPLEEVATTTPAGVVSDTIDFEAIFEPI
jgi:hypothetical protein